MRVFEAFAGIGAQRKALNNINANYSIVGLSEWYVPAIISYNAIHHNFTKKDINHDESLEKMVKYLESKTLSMDSKKPLKKGFWKKKRKDEIRIVYSNIKLSEKEGNIFDVKNLHKRKLEDVDLLTYSFPCQDLSQQGKQNGMKKGSNTRSGLLWEIEKALDSTDKNKLPQFLLLENVFALSHQKNQREFSTWRKKLEKLGYKNHFKVLNSGDFGSSQIRRRFFMISSLNKKVKLPFGNKKPIPLKKILNKKLNEKDLLLALDKYDLTKSKLTPSNIKKSTLKDYTTFNSEAYVYDPNFSGPTLTASGANSRIKISKNGKIIKMNAEEAYRYMGFNTKDFNKVNNLNYLSNSKMIYTCGNSIPVEVMEEIMKVFVKVFNET